MKHLKKRIVKIVDEMMTYFFSIGATDININVFENEEMFKITFNSNYLIQCKSCIEELVKSLNCAKNQEMEEYYWELVGDCDVDTELPLVGMMINEAELDIEDDFVEVILYRYK